VYRVAVARRWHSHCSLHRDVNDLTDALARLRLALDGARSIEAKLLAAAEILREAGSYRWVGLYEVAGDEIALAAWSGPGEPEHPRLPITDGLCGAAVRGKRSITVGDVSLDPLYRTTFESTRSEIVVPILDVVDGRARGVIDVESDRLDAFGEDDRMLLEHGAAEIATELSPSPG
jgi:L-methionine (R)-S-oxide reductase